MAKPKVGVFNYDTENEAQDDDEGDVVSKKEKGFIF
jgi:hypothetical protein